MPQGFEAVRRGTGGNALLKLLLVNLAVGVLVAVGTVGGLLLSDAQGLRGLLMNDRDPVVGIVLLTFGFVITLGSAAMGAAIMTLPRDGSGGRGRRDPVPAAEPALVRVAARGARPGART